MTIDEAQAHAQQMLIEAGFDFARPDPSLAWDVFKRFALVPIESGGGRECEEVWVEANDGEGYEGYFDFVRQCSQYTEDEAEWAEQITFHFTCEPTVQLGFETVTIQAENVTDLAKFFREVESSKAFQVGSEFKGWSFEVRVDAC